MYVGMIINYCTCKHICGWCRAWDLSFSNHMFHPPIIKQFDLFSEGPLYCLCTVSLTDLVRSYLELRD